MVRKSKADKKRKLYKCLSLFLFGIGCIGLGLLVYSYLNIPELRENLHKVLNNLLYVR